MSTRRTSGATAARVLTVCLAALAFFAGACVSPRGAPPPPDPAVSRSGGSGATASGGRGGESSDGPLGGESGQSAPAGCAPGTHVCAGTCLPDNAPESCGSSCQPCPGIIGGMATCDGRRCGVKCPDGQKPCGDKCVGETETCSRTCQPGFHDCEGLCVDNTMVSSCGVACDSCPQPPPGGAATCDGTKCDFTCEVGKRCGERCGECCADGDCNAGPGKTATCDLTTLTCKSACADGTKECNGQCIEAGGCCVDGDCPRMAGQVGKCDGSNHTCQYSCAGDTKPCAGKCIPNGSCCDDKSCGGNFACVNNSCSTSTCRAGWKRCGATCIANASCCEDRDCSGDFACVGNVCSKSMCRSGYKSCNGRCIPFDACCNDGSACAGGGVCKGGKCLACDPATRPTCEAGGVKQCAGDGSRYQTTACPRGCTGGACCGAGTEAAGNSCVACGGPNQPCCKVASPACGAGLSCDGGRCLYQCAGCNASPHCDDGNVVTGKCNTANGTCTKTPVTACTGGRTCQNNACVCPAGKVFVGGQCVFQCTGCKTSNHCGTLPGGGSAVLREVCNPNTGKCDPMTVDSCSSTEVCQGNMCTCGNNSQTCNGACIPNNQCCGTCSGNKACDTNQTPARCSTTSCVNGYNLCDMPDFGFNNQCVREQIICAAMSPPAGGSRWGFWNDAYPCGVTKRNSAMVHQVMPSRDAAACRSRCEQLFADAKRQGCPAGHVYCGLLVLDSKVGWVDVIGGFRRNCEGEIP